MGGANLRLHSLSESNDIGRDSRLNLIAYHMVLRQLLSKSMIFKVLLILRIFL